MAISMDIVQKYIDSALKSEVLEDSFIPFTLPKREDESKTIGQLSCPGTKRILLTLSTSSEPDNIIKHYVNQMTQVKSPAKFDALFNVLRLLVQQHPNLGKAICEALLSCEKLDYYNQNSWMRSFGLITDILPNVDYKGVRDILKYVLEIIYSLPDRFDTSIIPQLDTLYATFSMILDRDACLLPAYLSLDELQKKITQGNAPVWKFAELFYHFIESFRPTAQIFSIVNRPDLLPVVGCSTSQGNPSWRLDAISAKFQLKGLLPYKDKLKEPQVGQVRYLLEQPYSRDMVCATLSLGSKPTPQTRCAELIEQLAISIIHAMDRSEADIEAYSECSADNREHLFQWTHLSNNVSFYLVHNHSTISFNQLVDSLCDKLKSRNHRNGSEHLMWAMLQYIIGIQTPKTTLNDFVAIIKIFDLLYSTRRPLPLPKEDFPYAPHVLASASIWLQLVKRAELDQCKFLKPLPPALQLHYEYILNLKAPEEPSARVNLRDVIFLNAHGTNKNGYPVNNFVDCLCKVVPEHNPNPMTVQPLPMTLLDSMTTHSKIAILHNITNRIIAIAQNKSNGDYLITPALIETYARLLVFTDSESYGIKSFVNHLLGGQQALCRFQAWSIYHVLLEMYSHRVHHVPIHYKYQILISLHNLSPMIYSANQMQLSMTMEAVELKLLLGLSNYEALNMPINTRHANDAKTVRHMINGDSEELNKVLVLVLARSTHITSSEHVTASFLEDILSDINKVTPLSWSSSTLNFFPLPIKDFFNRNATIKETDKDQLKSAVEEEYRKWKAMSIEPSTLLPHFSQPSAPPLFMCILWRMLLDNENLDQNPVVYQILDNIRIRSLSTQLRTFVDYVVYEFSSTVGGHDVQKLGKALDDLVFKHHVISFDRLILCMCLRSFDGCAAQVCFFIIQMLLFKVSNIKNIVKEFCTMQSPEHWKEESRSFETNMEFQQKHPEKCYHEYLTENNIPSTGKTLPSFFSNVCLRLLPVLDILIHRALEMRIVSPNAAIKIDTIFESFGGLYKFHDKPLTYLYNTLHYYDSQLPLVLKKKVTSSIVGAFKDIRPPTWCLSENFLQYLNNKEQQDEWNPGPDYYKKIIGRLVDTLQGKNTFYHTDWRFNEFPNVKAHAVHVTAIELMTLPVSPTVVGNAILDLVLTSYVNQDRSTMSQWMNAIGLIMTALPPTYYTVLNTKILEYMKSPLLTNPTYTRDILHLMNFCDSNEWMYESQISYLVALTHAIWHHSSTGQIFSLPSFWSMFKQAVETESQFLFVCCLIGPFLSRLERSRILMDVVVELYEMLGKVDSTSEIQHLNTISDFFYHIKYMFTGNSVKNDIERCIRNFKPRLQYCLRFITHLNINTNDAHVKHE